MHISKRPLFVLVGLLLLQLFIRAHHITNLPIFMDEYSHIQRATGIYDFARHPAMESRGKFLFYFLPGIFDLADRTTALFLSRTSVALASLLTSAVIFQIGRQLLDERAGIMGAAFYGLVPFTFFFERMVLADPWAGLMATTCVWMAIRFAERASGQRAVWLGAFMAFTIAAKLTMAFVCVMPAVTILVLGKYSSWRDLWRRYGRLSILVNGVVIGLWLLVLIPSGIYTLQTHGTQNYILYDPHLVGVSAAPLTLRDKIEQLWEKMDLLVSGPMAVVLIGAVIVGMIHAPRRIGVVMGWLILAWFPVFFIIDAGAFQSRYLMSGFGAVAVLFGMGCIVGLDWILGERRRLSLLIGAGMVGVWGIGFVLPFARTTMSNPAALHLPQHDEKDYLGGWFNAYGLHEAVDFVDELREPMDDAIYVVMATRYCLPPVYQFQRVEYVCARMLFTDEHSDINWQQSVIGPLQEGKPMYLIAEYSVDMERFRHYDDVQWEALADFAKPQSGEKIRVWRLRLPDE